jgi:hypothetical protein
MKKISSYAIIALLMLAFAPSQSEASAPSPAQTQTTQSAEVRFLSARLAEIKAMDMSKMSSLEKKQLRKEVRTIKGNKKTVGNGGIYLSVGAVIIIVLLLIILL